jgi:hypothetical protein
MFYLFDFTFQCYFERSENSLSAAKSLFAQYLSINIPITPPLKSIYLSPDSIQFA